MNINMGVTGNIGDKMKLNTNYNTQATFDFENQVKLNYEGSEDEIVQSVEAGNVSFPQDQTKIWPLDMDQPPVPAEVQEGKHQD